MLDIDFDFEAEAGSDTGAGIGNEYGGSSSTEDSSSGYSSNHPLEDVSGYTREDGTQVSDYVRTKADGIVENNLNYKG